jgi:hypothetical protein
MNIEEKIEQILNNPKTDWQESFLNKNIIVKEYFRLKTQLNNEFKEKGSKWMSQAVVNNQEKLIIFLSSFAQVEDETLAKSYGYSDKKIFEHLEYINACQNDPSPYKINLNLTRNVKYDYFRIYYSVMNNKAEQAIELIDEHFIESQHSILPKEFIEKSLDNPLIFNHIINLIQKCNYYLPNTSQYETVLFEQITQKIIENKTLKKDHAEFFSEISSRLSNDSIKDRLFNYLLENAQPNDKSIIEYTFYLFKDNNDKLETVYDFFKFKDEDYYELIDNKIANLEIEQINTIYHKIQNHTAEGEKKLIYSALHEGQEAFLDFLFTKNQYDFKQYNNEIIKFLAKNESPYFDKMMDVLFMKNEAKYLNDNLNEDNTSKETIKPKMKI